MLWCHHVTPFIRPAFITLCRCLIHLNCLLPTHRGEEEEEQEVKEKKEEGGGIGLLLLGCSGLSKM